MNKNLEIYDKVRSVPQGALKEITGGRLKGSSINPMWRIKTLTEMFGPCGIGWKIEITKQWVEPTGADTIAVFTNINLYVKHDGEWSEPIAGTGGNKLLASEKNGPYTNEECYKMSLTDALSVACKYLGIGADVYWDTDVNKPTPEDSSKASAGFIQVIRDIMNDIDKGYESIGKNVS